MDLAKIKKLVKQNGDKFIFVENGEPEIVVMSFKEYEKLGKSGANTEFAELDTKGLEETEFVVPAETGPLSVMAESMSLPVRLEDIRLEDLPI